MMSRAQAYGQFAAWLQAMHPALFAQLLAASQTLSGLQALYRGPLFSARAAQSFGDYADYFDIGDSAADLADAAPDFTLPEIDVTASAVDEGPSLEQEIASDTAGASSPITSQIAPDSVPTAPPVAPSAAASTVGSTLVANAGLLTATLNAAATVVTTKAAAQVIQAQAQRASSGLAPAAVSYVPVTDATTGIVSTVPVLNTANGQLPLSAAGIDSLAPATFLQNYGLYIVLGLAALVVALE